MPMQSTRIDFWRLANQCNCNVIVMLNPLDEENDVNIAIDYYYVKIVANNFLYSYFSFFKCKYLTSVKYRLISFYRLIFLIGLVKVKL